MSTILSSLTILTILLNVNCNVLPLDHSDNYQIVRPLLLNWMTESIQKMKLTIILDDQDKNTFQIPPLIYKHFNSSTNLYTLQHLLTNHPKNNTFNHQAIETGNLVLFAVSNILNIRNILQTPYLNSFWHSENIYLLQQSQDLASLNRTNIRFLEWAFDRLWRFRRVYKILVTIGDNIIRYDPFEYDNHIGRYVFNETCDWYCIKFNRNNNTILSVTNYNAINISDYIYKYQKRFNGYPLKISIFETTTMIQKGDDFYGVDAKYIEEIIRMMNFTPIFLRSKLQYGWLENGVFFGPLGDIVYQKADVSFNQYFQKDYLTNEIEFPVWITSDSLCVLVPKASPIPEHLVIVKVFTPGSWIFIFISHFFISVIYITMKEMRSFLLKQRENFRPPCERGKHQEEQWRRTKTTRVFDSMDDVYIFKLTHFRHPEEASKRQSKAFAELSLPCLLSVSKYLTKVVFQLMQPFETTRPWFPERFAVICSLILSLILNGVFTSQLASSFNKLSYYEDIHTLEDLERSGYTILTNSKDIMEDALNDAEPSLMSRLGTRMKYANETEIKRRLFMTKDAGFLQRKGVVPLKFNEYQRSKLHVVEECPKDYILTHLITKGSPFLRRMNNILGRLNNGGFYQKWFQGMSLSLKQAPNEDNKSNLLRQLTMKHFLIPFAILSIGLLTSTIVFAWEQRQYIS